jgi:hypothetical protein
MNDLETQFDKIVAHEPGGDADRVLAGATRAVARRDRRRRAVLAGGIGAVVLAAVLVAVQVGSNDDLEPIVDETTRTTSVTPRVLAADDGSIAISMSVPQQVVAGDRVWAELEVRNIGEVPLYWQAGGATPPVSAELNPGVVRPVREWSGRPEDLAESVHDELYTVPFVGNEHTGLTSIARTSESQMKALAPGEQQRFRVSADLRLPPGMANQVEASVSARFYDRPEDYGGTDVDKPRPDVTAHGTLSLTALPIEASDALSAFADDPRLQRYLDDTRIENGGWYVELAWWRGAWELTVTPRFGDDIRGQSRYRLRWRDGAIVDARRIWWDQAPADDPEGAHFPGAPPDEVDER